MGFVLSCLEFIVSIRIIVFISGWILLVRLFFRCGLGFLGYVFFVRV